MDVWFAQGHTLVQWQEWHLIPEPGTSPSVRQWAGEPKNKNGGLGETQARDFLGPHSRRAAADSCLLRPGRLSPTPTDHIFPAKPLTLAAPSPGQPLQSQASVTRAHHPAFSPLWPQRPSFPLLSLAPALALTALRETPISGLPPLPLEIN